METQKTKAWLLEQELAMEMNLLEINTVCASNLIDSGHYQKLRYGVNV